MRVGDDTKKALLKIGAEHTMKDGKERSLEEIVKILIEEHKLKQKWNEIIMVIGHKPRSSAHVQFNLSQNL